MRPPPPMPYKSWLDCYLAPGISEGSNEAAYAKGELEELRVRLGVLAAVVRATYDTYREMEGTDPTARRYFEDLARAAGMPPNMPTCK
jgi:hypothetical protein